MPKNRYLDSIDVPEPCDAPWEEMVGDERKRFCLNCEKDVYNLSAMSRREARKLVAGRSGKICVRYARLPDGRLWTNDRKLYRITRRAPTAAAGVIAATISLSAATYAQGEWDPLPPTETAEKPAAAQMQRTKPAPDAATGQISFTVADETGAPIPGAEARMTLEGRGGEFIVLTDEQGVARFASLPPGRYKLEVSYPHFDKATRHLRITRPVEPNLRITLSVSGMFVGTIVVTERYEIPLFELIMQEDAKALESQLAAGFDVGTRDGNGVTALHVAVAAGNAEALKLLLRAGAKTDAADKDGRTPLMMLEDDDETPAPVLELLIAAGADVNARDGKGRTPLMYAADPDREHLPAVVLFLGKGAAVDAADKEGNTALMHAVQGYSEEIVEQLLKAGADPNAKNRSGETPLSLAGKDEDMIALLRRYGAIR